MNETYAEFIPKFLKKRQLQEESDNASTRDIYLDSKDDEDEDEDNFLSYTDPEYYVSTPDGLLQTVSLVQMMNTTPEEKVYFGGTGSFPVLNAEPWKHALKAFTTDLRTTPEFKDSYGVFRNAWGGVMGPSDLLCSKPRTSSEVTALKVPIFFCLGFYVASAEILFFVLLLERPKYFGNE